MIIKPTWLGRPLYPGGFPLKPEQVSAGDKTIQQIYLDGIDEEGKTNYSEDDQETLKYYILYYMQAPIWDIDDPIDEVELIKLSVWELIQKCLKYGLDPL